MGIIGSICTNLPQRHHLGRVRAVVTRLVKAREAEVAQFHFTAVVQQQVAQLQVAVEHPPPGSHRFRV